MDISSWCREMGIKNFYIYNNSINCNESVNLNRRSLKELPFKFGTINGDFNIDENELTSMANFPFLVSRRFTCRNNKIKDALHGPHVVGSDYVCSVNKITNLIGLPMILNGNLYCEDNEIDNWKIMPRKITGNLHLYANKTKAILPSHVIVKGQIFI